MYVEGLKNNESVEEEGGQHFLTVECKYCRGNGRIDVAKAVFVPEEAITQWTSMEVSLSELKSRLLKWLPVGSSVLAFAFLALFRTQYLALADPLISLIAATDDQAMLKTAQVFVLVIPPMAVFKLVKEGCLIHLKVLYGVAAARRKHLLDKIAPKLEDVPINKVGLIENVRKAEFEYVLLPQPRS